MEKVGELRKCETATLAVVGALQGSPVVNLSQPSLLLDDCVALAHFRPIVYSQIKLMTLGEWQELIAACQSDFALRTGQIQLHHDELRRILALFNGRHALMVPMASDTGKRKKLRKGVGGRPRANYAWMARLGLVLTRPEWAGWHERYADRTLDFPGLARAVNAGWDEEQATIETLRSFFKSRNGEVLLAEARAKLKCN